MLERAARPTLLASLLLLALLADAAVAVDPNPRATPAMTLGGTITGMAMAASTNHVLAGRADPGRSFGDPANAEVWTLWDAAGERVVGGRADESSCAATTTVNPLTDACIGDVTDVAISNNGQRFVIVARGNAAGEGRILFMHQSGGAVTTVESRELSGESPTSVAIDPDGSKVVVGTDRGGNPAAGRVRAYDWSATGPGAITQAWATDTATAITDLALGNDRVVVAAGGNNHYRFTAAGAVTTDTTPSDQGAAVAAVDIGRVNPEHWSAAVTTAGELLLSSDTRATTPYVVPLGTSPKRAVAMTQDGLVVAAGDDAGVVRLYLNCDLVTTPCAFFQRSVTVPGAVTALAFSSDQRYLAVGTAQGTSLVRVGASATSADLYWSHATGAVVDVAAGLSANVVTAAAGSTATAFTTVRAGTLTVPASVTLQPGTQGQSSLTVKNTGNREDTFLFDPLVLPTGWTGSLSRTTVTLAPDATVQVLLNVTPPASAAPGSSPVSVTLRVAGSPQATQVPFQVAQAHRWLLSSEGATNRPVSAGGSTTFTFRATNLGNAADTSTVVQAVDHAGWTAVVTPSTLSAGPGETVAAQVTLTAPADAEQLDAATVTLGLSADPATTLRLTGTVGARFGVEVEADPEQSTGTGGVPTLVAVRVRNTGNVPDTFVVTVSGLPAGWQASSIPGITGTVQPGATADVTVQAVPPQDATPGSYSMDIRAMSQGDQGKTDSATHTVKVDGSSDATSTSKKGSKGSPGPALPLLGLALAAAALARRK